MTALDAAVPARVRQERMRAVVAEREFTRVTDLSRMFRISEVTVRNDLDTLAARGHVRRIRGGAVPPSEPAPERPFEESATANAAEKAAIGGAAAAMVSPGETVILDVGTTAAAIAQALIARTDLHDLVVFTNGLNIALALEAAAPRVTVVVTGGTLRPLQHSLVEPLAGHVLEQINADLVFLGCNGVHPIHGVTNRNLPEAAVKQKMLAAARRRVVVADASKLGEVALAHLCDLPDVDVLITAGQADPELLERLADGNVDVRVAT